jgi:hypothetical protein
MNKQEFNDLTKNHIFTVTFIKKDGSIRVMNGRRLVHRYLKGTGKPITDGRIVIMDMQNFRKEMKAGKDRFTAGNRSYRSIWPESIIELKVSGKTYKVAS